MGNYLMKHDTYDAKDAGLLNSKVSIEFRQRSLSGIIPSNMTFPAYIHWSPQTIENDT